MVAGPPLERILERLLGSPLSAGVPAQVLAAAWEVGLAEADLCDWAQDLGYSLDFWTGWGILGGHLDELPAGWTARLSQDDWADWLVSEDDPGLRWIAEYSAALRRGAEGAPQLVRLLDAVGTLRKADRDRIGELTLRRSLKLYLPPEIGKLGLFWGRAYLAAVSTLSARSHRPPRPIDRSPATVWESIQMGWQPEALSAGDWDVYLDLVADWFSFNHRIRKPRAWPDYQQHTAALVQVALNPLADRALRALCWYVALIAPGGSPPKLKYPKGSRDGDRINQAVEDRIARKIDGADGDVPAFLPQSRSAALREAYAVAGVEQILSRPTASGRRLVNLIEKAWHDSLRMGPEGAERETGRVYREARRRGLSPDEAEAKVAHYVGGNPEFGPQRSLDAPLDQGRNNDGGDGDMTLHDITRKPDPAPRFGWRPDEIKERLDAEANRLRLTPTEGAVLQRAWATLQAWIEADLDSPPPHREPGGPAPPAAKMAKSRLRVKARKAGCGFLLQLLDAV